jgi:hypothetical protein
VGMAPRKNRKPIGRSTKERTVKHNNWLILVGVILMLGTMLVPSMAFAASQSPDITEEDGPSLSPPDQATDSDKTSDIEKKDDSSAKEPAVVQPPEKPAPLPKVRHQLTQSQAALRDQVRQTLAVFQKQPFGTRQNTPGEILDFCLPYGCATEIMLADASGERRANGITCLCWNFAGGGFEPLVMNDSHIAARLGYGVQSQPSQFFATLAFARVQANYPLRVENAVRTVADLVESEKLACRSGSDLSLKLIGLAYYVEDATWKNDLGEEWSLEKVVREELNQPALSAGDGGLNRLLGLAYANHRREKRNLPLDGQFARAEKYLSDFHKFAFNLQNADGSWGYFLSARGSTKDPAAQLRSTAYVLEWLALSLPEEQLGDPRVAASVNCVVQGLNTQRNRGSAPNLPPREINSIARALHALSIYDERFCQTADEAKPATEKPAAEQTATKPRAASSTPQRYPSTQSSR